jgi:hypothetical protein
MAAPFNALQTTGVQHQMGGRMSESRGSRFATDQRLLDREAQTRGWAAPLPDFTVMPRANEPIRQRVEWDTRDTMNNRLWSDMQVTGPKAVTATMLAQHPTAGANPMMPTAGRQDPRSYVTGPSYFPDAQPIRPGEARQKRPQLPPQSLYQNAWTTDLDIDGDHRNVAREVRQVVTEENYWRNEDAGARIMERTFQHQWIPQQVTNHIVNSQLDAAERLRPTQDDYNTDYMTRRF